MNAWATPAKMKEFAPTPKEISPVSVQTSGPEKHATRVGLQLNDISL